MGGASGERVEEAGVTGTGPIGAAPFEPDGSVVGELKIVLDTLPVDCNAENMLERRRLTSWARDGVGQGQSALMLRLENEVA